MDRLSYLSIALCCAYATLVLGDSLWPRELCGLRFPVDEEMMRITMGQPTVEHEFPWIVSIWNPDHHLCGGSIIADRWILTATHCFTGKKNHDDIIVSIDQNYPRYRIYAGLYNLSNLAEAEMYRVSAVRLHPDFSPHFDHDLALIRTDRPIQLQTTTSKSGFEEYSINAICLPPYDTDDEVLYPPSIATISGWGHIHFEGENAVLAQTLLKAEVPLVTRDVCEVFYMQDDQTVLAEKTLCYGKGRGNETHEVQDTCQGDSGGPLTVALNDYTASQNRTYQLGVVSNGRNCGVYPGVYTEIHSHLWWIVETIANFKESDADFVQPPLAS